MAYQTKLSVEEAVARNRRKDGLEVMNDDLTPEQMGEFMQKVYAQVVAATRAGGAVYVAHADALGHIFRKEMIDAGIPVRQVLVWAKDVFVMGRQDYQWKHEPILYGWKPGASHRWYGDRSQTTILEFERPRKSEQHPTMKPVALVEYCVGNSTKKGDGVLDLFGGSGTTLIACEKLGRKCFTMELDPAYADVIRTRWEQATGRKAVLTDGTGKKGEGRQPRQNR